VNLIESLLTGLDEARRHWGQTLLSLLGLILGTGSIVTVLALFGGQTALTEQFLNEVGGRGTIVVYDREPSAHPGARELASKRLTFHDAQFLRDRATALMAVSPGWAKQLSYRVGNVSFDGQVIGTVPDYMTINDIKPLVGRYLSDLDVRQQARVAVLGWKYADSLFGRATAALGQVVSIGEKSYRVVGVLERRAHRHRRPGHANAGGGQSVHCHDFAGDRGERRFDRRLVPGAARGAAVAGRGAPLCVTGGGSSWWSMRCARSGHTSCGLFSRSQASFLAPPRWSR
jgi:hypothetical protein